MTPSHFRENSDEVSGQFYVTIFLGARNGLPMPPQDTQESPIAVYRDLG